MEILRVENLCKIYGEGEATVNALKNVSFSLEKGELAAVVGESGSGKSTLLNCIGALDNPTSGTVLIDRQDLFAMREEERTIFRRRNIGFVFQFYNLVQNLTAIENVELATQICKKSLNPEQVMEKVGLADRKNNFPSQLSGGEQQRVAIARAIAKNPKLLLCDEPTGALDYKTGKQILKLLQDMSRIEKMTVIIITHNGAIAPMADKVIKFKNGTAEDMIINKNPTPIEEIEW